MYAPGYGYPNVPPNFNNAAPHPNQNPHMQPGSVPAQPGQQMMYNPNQFAGMGGPQGHFVGAPNPAMMSGAGPAGMMQNAAMPPHMAANGQMAFQQQQAFQGNPYGPNVPSPAGQQFPPNYMAASGMPGFPMNPGVTQQPQQPQQQQQQQQQPQQSQPQQQQQQQQQQPQHQMMHRMHPQQANVGPMAGGSTPQRQMSSAQGTPNNGMQQQSQFATPQPPSHSQTPTNPQQHATVTTPQTPTFPSGGQLASADGGASGATPLSPGTESKEKERFSVLLEINQELLYESIQLSNTLQELKKEAAASGDGGGNEQAKKERAVAEQDYNQCMRRIHANLTYLAALADRKGSVPVPPSPGFLSAPPLNFTLKIRPSALGSDSADSGGDPMADRQERGKLMHELYGKLQALFPGMDPKKEHHFQPAQRPQGPQGQQVHPGQAGLGPGQRPPGSQASPTSGQNQRALHMPNMMSGQQNHMIPS